MTNMNQILCKSNFLGNKVRPAIMLRRSDKMFVLVSFGLNGRPFTKLLLLPKKFLTLPMRGTITLEMKIDIKRSANESSKIVDMKTNNLARN